MRYIRIPANVILTQPNGDIIKEAKPVKFLFWLLESVLIDPKLGKSVKDVMMAADIKKKVMLALKSQPDIHQQDTEDHYLELSDAEWDLLKPVVEEPTNGYNVSVAIQLVDFMRTFLNPKDKDPRDEVKEAAPTVPEADVEEPSVQAVSN